MTNSRMTNDELALPAGAISLPWKRQLQALAVLLMLGVVKLPVEQAATAQLRAARLLTPPVGISVRENLGQMAFAASMGGLRSLIASITYLRAYHAWENIEWAKVDSLFQLTTRLQPRYENYWDEAAWHMAYNAASSYLYNEDIEPMVRGKFFEQYIQRGIDILNEGLQYLPDDPRLWSALAEIYERRVHDPKKAAECYLQVHRLTKNDRYARFAAYQYALTSDPDLWRQAYTLMKSSYDRKQRTPTLLDQLKTLEEKLNIPLMQRIPDKRPVLDHGQQTLGPSR